VSGGRGVFISIRKYSHRERGGVEKE